MSEWVNRFDAIEQVTPPVADAQLRKIPAKRGVFLMLAENDKPIILLPAADMRARLRNRLAEPLEDKRTRTLDLREITRKLCWKLTSSHFETDLEYFEIARRIWPDAFAKLLAWKPAWFVAVNPDDQYPHFVSARGVPAAGGCFGPFSTAGEAEGFIKNVQDAFDLCRDYACLRLSPNSPRCAYAQMGKCLSPCDGTISMDDYRRTVAEAADFAGGCREVLHNRLEEQMAAAAKNLAFEKAGAIKAKLQRLGQFDKPAYYHVRPVESFHYILIQQGPKSSKAKAFLVNGGAIHSGGVLDYPPKAGQIAALISKMTNLAARDMEFGKIELLRMGLVSQYLFSSPNRRGVALRFTDDLSVERVSSVMKKAARDLKLKAPKPRNKKQTPKKASK